MEPPLCRRRLSDLLGTIRDVSRLCVAWSNHNWVRPDPLALDRHCSKCGLLEPRPHDRPDRDTCDHQWAVGTFRRICDWCGKVDRSVVVGPRRPYPFPEVKSDQWRSRVRMVFTRDGDGCFYCLRPLVVDDARLDHFIPRSKGGPDSLTNRRAACKDCDVRKADKLPWEFLPDRFPRRFPLESELAELERSTL